MFIYVHRYIVYHGSEKKLCEPVLSRSGPCVIGVPRELLWHGSEGLADVLFRNDCVLARRCRADVQRDAPDH